MTQPLDRTCRIPQMGKLAVEQGEFWVENPFEMPEKGENLSAWERNQLYLNAGNLKFINASFASACDIEADSRSAVALDYDNDGDEDLLIGSVGGGAIRLFRNNQPQQNSIKIRLNGSKSNRSGIGSRITVRVGEQLLVRDLFPANGFMGSGPAEVTFGLGKHQFVEEMAIRWPNGKQQSVTGVQINHAIEIREGSDELRQVPLQR
ncbi:MAG: CRTAC1 family protein [Planctomycetota bacterium]|nr:CRTAC1 family protein [Planctomycetota bacterium]